MRACVVCYRSARIRCSGCHKAIYCSERCQRHHWNVGHREECQGVLRHIEGESGADEEPNYILSNVVAADFLEGRITLVQLLDKMEANDVVRTEIVGPRHFAAISRKIARVVKPANAVTADRDLVTRIVRLFESNPDAIEELFISLIERNHADVCKIMVQVGAIPDLDITWMGVTTPLVMAIRARSLPLVAAMLARGANPNYYPRRHEWTRSEYDLAVSVPRPIISALLEGDTATINLLLDRGVKIDNTLKAYTDALHTAFEREEYNVWHIVNFSLPEHYFDIRPRRMEALQTMFATFGTLCHPYFCAHLLIEHSGPGLGAAFKMLGITPGYRPASQQAIDEIRARVPDFRPKPAEPDDDTLLNKAAFALNLATVRTMIRRPSASDDLKLVGAHGLTPLMSLVRGFAAHPGKAQGLLTELAALASSMVKLGGASNVAPADNGDTIVSLLRDPQIGFPSGLAIIETIKEFHRTAAREGHVRDPIDD